jgi:hypothetical protein
MISALHFGSMSSSAFPTMIYHRFIVILSDSPFSTS